ncbi:aminocarboxymuconate-semialdehyde decarboxylase [Paraburkholderia sp. BL27I4N3]|uniref:amidohydrolase family protein n=1 Tax=Paraburkholderia sp. BL27I4N3 TaxID=1938805 RepID=UPI000E238D1A|nr:amidohydrolase family protein [Paraburkholderia sp. BL27I4N3]REE07385.1 aminocarboxymuconate-semialdehyde decarboxylase [Paraburkholderia sp. BL27I4N3]
MKIDIHGHFVTRAYYDELETLPGVRYERRSSGLGYLIKEGRNWLPVRESMFDPDDQLRDMDRKGIDMRILSLSTPSVYLFDDAKQREAACRDNNDAIIARVAADPSRFRAFVTLPLPDVDASLRELDRVIDAPGVVGITIGSNLGGMKLNDLSLEPLWARLDRDRIPVFEHPMDPVFGNVMDEFAMHIRVGFLFDTSLAVTRMIYGGVFERYPNFPFIVAHTGAAFLDLLERLDNGYRHYVDCQQHISRLPSEFAKQFYYDSCAFFTPTIMMARAAVGVERLLFGTDYPFIDQGPDHVERLPIDDVEKKLIFSGNATRLLKL